MSSCFNCSKKQRRRGASPVTRRGRRRDSISTTSDLSDPPVPTIVSLQDLVCPIADGWRRNRPDLFNGQADRQSRTSTNSTSSRLSGQAFLTPSPTRAGRSPIVDFERGGSLPPSPGVQRLRLALWPSPRASESLPRSPVRSAQRRLDFGSDQMHSPTSSSGSPQRQPPSQDAQIVPANRSSLDAILSSENRTPPPDQQPFPSSDLPRMEPSRTNQDPSKYERPLTSPRTTVQTREAGPRTEAPINRAKIESQALGSAPDIRESGKTQSPPLPLVRTTTRQLSSNRASPSPGEEPLAQALKYAAASSGAQGSLVSQQYFLAEVPGRTGQQGEQKQSLRHLATSNASSSSPNRGRVRPLQGLQLSSPAGSASPTAAQNSPLGRASIHSSPSLRSCQSVSPTRGALGAALALQKLQFRGADGLQQRRSAQHASPARQPPKTAQPQPQRSSASRPESKPASETPAANRQVLAAPERPTGLSTNSFKIPTSLDVGGRTMNLRIEVELLISDKNEAIRPKMSEFVKSFAHSFNRDLGLTTSQMPPDLREPQYSGDYDKWYWKKTEVDRGEYSPCKQEGPLSKK